MEEHRSITLSLRAEETRQLLLEAGSTVLVLSGQLGWRDPPAWVADTVITGSQVLGAEAVRVVERSGWVEFSAVGPVQAVIIAPESVAFWSQVGHCLARLFGNAGAPKPLP